MLIFVFLKIFYVPIIGLIFSKSWPLVDQVSAVSQLYLISAELHAHFLEFTKNLQVLTIGLTNGSLSLSYTSAVLSNIKLVYSSFKTRFDFSKFWPSVQSGTEQSEY